MHNTESRQELKQALTATIAAWMKESGLEGLAAEDAAATEFPGVPGSIIFGAAMMLEDEREEAWWSRFERSRIADALRAELIIQKAAAGTDNEFPF